ncbi:uncharacterized protein DUF1302 [Paraperlucidibaca baekdonensis]|uniref:Uncharacterized protein DUF1302 n=1 Tax=Paraperlucidibaca baekdonensis TaxID=748120 RepID=A0A3E0H2M4_9GAMM|nr:DUF1302 domain-containing protein [Paraperlucidibaca baekdonensis]REH37568.1 uncharacterized protein DUF1302 [Paraperlucidibaca baekdonensis]
MTHRVLGRPRPLALAVALLSSSFILPSHAARFDFAEGEGTFVFDTTLSVGTLIRAEDRDPRIVGIVNGGTSRSVNEDSGNLNYEKGEVVSTVLKASHDMDISYGRTGLFVRFGYAADLAAQDKEELPLSARKRLEFDSQVFDWYLRHSFDIAGRRLNVRVGSQVVSWGEGALIQGGINTINPIDLQRLRVPGSELKEAFIPVPMVWASQQITDDITLEAFYQLKWEHFEIDPMGTFFSTTDVFSNGGEEAFTGFGRTPDRNSPGFSPEDAQAGAVPRGPDRDAKDSGQFGAALRWLVGDTELGFYGMNYHSRLPLASTVAGTPTNAALPFLRDANTASVFAEYPEDIQLFGISFNTPGPFGIALSGEYSYRPNLPVQISTTELTLAALGLPNQAGAPNNPDPGTEIRGYRSVEAHQFQILAIKAIPNILGATQAIALFEAAAFYQDLPDGILFNGPGVYLPGAQTDGQVSVAGVPTTFQYPNPIVANGSVQPEGEGYATKESYGIRLIGRLEYADVFAGVNLLPRIVYASDIKGVSQFFNEGAQSISVGVNAIYNQVWSADFSYTNFFGGRVLKGTDCQSSLTGTVGPLSTGVLQAVGNVVNGVITPQTQGDLACGAPAGPTALPNGQSRNFESHTNPNIDRDFFAASLSYSF